MYVFLCNVQDCPHVSRTKEDFYTVRCQVTDMKNLYVSSVLCTASSLTSCMSFIEHSHHFHQPSTCWQADEFKIGTVFHRMSRLHHLSCTVASSHASSGSTFRDFIFPVAAPEKWHCYHLNTLVAAIIVVIGGKILSFLSGAGNLLVTIISCPCMELSAVFRQR